MKPLYSAMRAFGVSSFTMEVVATYEERRSAFRHEGGLINFLRNSGQDPYNLSTGRQPGTGRKTKVHTHRRVRMLKPDIYDPKGDKNREAIINALRSGGGLFNWCRSQKIEATSVSAYLHGRRNMPPSIAKYLGIYVEPEPSKPRGPKPKKFDRPSIFELVLSQYVFVTDPDWPNTFEKNHALAARLGISKEKLSSIAIRARDRADKYRLPVRLHGDYVTALCERRNAT